MLPLPRVFFVECSQLLGVVELLQIINYFTCSCVVTLFYLPNGCDDAYEAFAYLGAVLFSLCKILNEYSVG